MLLLVLALQTAASPTRHETFRLMPEGSATSAPKARYRLTSERGADGKRAIWKSCPGD